jgi:serine/threonine protein kinase
MPGLASAARRLLCQIGFGAASAAAASTLLPGRPLQTDPPVLLLLAGLAVVVANALPEGGGLRQLAVLTGVMLVAGLIGAARQTLHQSLAHPRLFVALTLIGTASLLQALRPARREPRPVSGGRRAVTINDRWELLRPLLEGDRGGFSELWLGADRNRDGRPVVVKLESGLPERRGESRRRLQREQHVLAPIQSRWVVGFHDAGRDELSGRQYVVLDYHPAGSLAKSLEERRELQMAWALQVVSGILRALVVLHEELSQRLVHRDVTPRNVLLRRDGTTPLLCDFGSAHPLDRPDRSADDQITAGIVYSPYYAPPEIVDRGLRDLWDPTPASDLYAAGSILYELLTGRPPYWREVQETHREFGQLVLDRDLRPLPATWVNPELPPAVDELLARLLAFRPEARPQGARRLLDDLRAIGRNSGALRIPLAELRSARIPVALGTTTTRRER